MIRRNKRQQLIGGALLVPMLSLSFAPAVNAANAPAANPPIELNDAQMEKVEGEVLWFVPLLLKGAAAAGTYYAGTYGSAIQSVDILKQQGYPEARVVWRWTGFSVITGPKRW